MNFKKPRAIKTKNGSVIIDFIIDESIDNVVAIVAKTIRQNPQFRVYEYFPGTQLQFRLYCFALNKTLAIQAIAAHFKQNDIDEIRPFVTLNA